MFLLPRFLQKELPLNFAILNGHAYTCVSKAEQFLSCKEQTSPLKQQVYSVMLKAML